MEYCVTNAQQELLGAIDNKNNTITVYIPYYVGLEYLNAIIKMDEGAKLLDSLDNEINLDGGPDPVRVGTDSVKYTVVAPTGERRAYTLLQKVLPFPDPLQATYALGDTVLTIPVNSYLQIVGNFESTNTNAKFFLTDKATGKIYNNLIAGATMAIGAQYTFRTNISPDALAGEYTVSMEHQGRSTNLPGLKLVYKKPSANFFNSTAAYAPGDTVTFNLPIANSTSGSILQQVERVYIKVKKAGSFTPTVSLGTFQVPTGFPESLYNTEIAMKIVSQSRTQLKTVFPEMPAGLYANSAYYLIATEGALDTNFGFYVDYAEGTGWGKGNLFWIANVSKFVVL